MKLQHVLFAALCGSAPMLAAGCATAPKPPTEEIHTQPVAAAPAPAPEAPAPAPAPKVDDDLASILRGDVLHFGFDQAELTSESRDRLQKISEVLQKHIEVAITISGNTDERGTEEYNLALGQRRAEVARKYLVSLGVAPNRVKTVSYGKERPANGSHDEQAWAENRRDEVSVSNP